MTRLLHPFKRSRSLPLLLILPIVASASIVSVPIASAQSSQPKPTTWIEFINNLINRQPRKGGSKPIEAICPITPRPVLDSSGFLPKYKPSLTANLQPTIAWQGSVGGIKIQDLKTRETWIKRTLGKSGLGIHQLKYDGKALVPDRDYSVVFLSARDTKTELIRHRFRTLPLKDIDTITETLDAIDLTEKTPDEITFEKALYLSGLDLISDAHALVLSAPNPSLELRRAIGAYSEDCGKEVAPDRKVSSPSPRRFK